jgi:hypothetical protein
MIDRAYAGHAGEAGQAWLPHEVMEGLILLAGLVLFLLVGLAVSLWRIRQLDRRLRTVERCVASDADRASSAGRQEP